MTTLSANAQVANALNPTNPNYSRMTYGGHTYAGAPYASTADPDQLRDRPIEFRVIRDGNVVEDAVFDVDPVVETANPYGDFCVVKMDDRGGEKFSEYPRGTRIDVEIAFSATSVIRRFTGYVVERRETEQSGADVLEVEAYSFDQFLRRNTVSNDQSGNLISEALQDIIETDTPVSYNAAKIDVGDDQELTRGYQGTPVETVLRDLAFKSNNEDFGVDDQLDAYFRPRETTHIDRGIDNSQWFNYDIPELGKEAINEVEVWFNDGDESVIVDDGTDKLDLQDNLNLPEPGTQRKELNRPLITDINDAEDIGRKYLAFRNSTLSGTVTTYGLFDAKPGDTIDIQIDPRGIDAEFVIAACEYRWGRDQTILTIVEKRGDVDDILSELSESVQRVEMEGADRDAPKNRITTTNATALVDVSVDADGNSPSGVKFVNDGRRAVRDGWTGDAPPDITTILVGDGTGELSRSNTALANQTASAAATQTLPDSTSVEYSASVTQTGVRELGLQTADGRLIARAVFDAAVDLDGTVTVTLAVSNDSSVSRGVLTNAGQETVRDVLADNTPATPDSYVYGSDDSGVSESDSALGNELVDASLLEVLIRTTGSVSDWQDIVGDIPDDVPLGVTDAGEFGTTIVNNVIEGEDGNAPGGIPQVSDGDYSDGLATQNVNVTDGVITWEITFQHRVPESDVGIRIRDEIIDDADDVDGLEWRFNGDTIDSLGAIGGGKSLGWTDLSDGGFYDVNVPAYAGGDLQPGTIYELELILDNPGSGTGEDYLVDLVSVYDERYESGMTFDNDNGGSSGYLDGPERYPELLTRSLAEASTRRNVTEARFDLDVNDTSGEFFVELANDGSTFARINNSSTGSVSFAAPERGVDVTVGVGRYSATSTQTPLDGNNPQRISVFDLFANPDATVPDGIGETNTRAIVRPGTITGETVRECGLKSGSALLSRHILAEFSLLADQRLASAEQTQFTSPD